MINKSYALLISPNANVVYSNAAPGLAEAELTIFNRGLLGGKFSDIHTAEISGVKYLKFDAPDLSDKDIAIVSNISSLFAIFELKNEALHPIRLTSSKNFSDTLITTQKYKGKTNTSLTQLLLNVTIATAADLSVDPFSAPLKVLDPMCGRGTTLNQAVMYGYDAYGVDLDSRDFDAYRNFITRWMKDQRLKHKAEVKKVHKDRREIGKLLNIEFSKTKEEFKSGDRQTIKVLNADTHDLGAAYGGSAFDVLVTDLPYGVQHGSQQRSAGLNRRPLELLTSVLPIWVRSIRTGGALGFSWNTRVASRSKVIEVLNAVSNLEVLDEGPYTQFRHFVDQAITRDILVARRRKA